MKAKDETEGEETDPNQMAWQEEAFRVFRNPATDVMENTLLKYPRAESPSLEQRLTDLEDRINPAKAAVMVKILRGSLSGPDKNTARGIASTLPAARHRRQTGRQ